MIDRRVSERRRGALNNDISQYLIQGDKPLVCLPELAKAIGVEEALILQQLHWLLRDKRNGKMVNGKRWVYNTYEGWLEYFPWMTVRTIRRYFKRLESMGAIEACQPEGGISRRKYYRVCVGSESYE